MFSKVSTAKPVVKKSAREREEYRKMRRLLIGGGAGVLAMTAGAFGVMSLGAPFETLEGGSIEDRLGISRNNGYVIPITTASRIDILIVGDTSCVFCRNFVDTGLGPMKVFAESEGLGLSYVSAGFQPTSMLTRYVSRCVVSQSRRLPRNGEDAVRALYALGPAIDGRGDTPQLDVVLNHARDLGVARTSLETCMGDTPADEAGTMRTLVDLFSVQSTPSFYVRHPTEPRLVSMINGYSNSTALLRQVSLALGPEATA